MTLKQSNQPDGDYIIERGVGRFKSGSTVDQFGVPKKAIDNGTHRIDRFLKSVDKHFQKTSDFILLDSRNLSKKDKDIVNQYINDNYSDQLDRLIKIE